MNKKDKVMVCPKCKKSSTFSITRSGTFQFDASLEYKNVWIDYNDNDEVPDVITCDKCNEKIKLENIKIMKKKNENMNEVAERSKQIFLGKLKEYLDKDCSVEQGIASWICEEIPATLILFKESKCMLSSKQITHQATYWISANRDYIEIVPYDKNIPSQKYTFEADKTIKDAFYGFVFRKIF